VTDVPRKSPNNPQVPTSLTTLKADSDGAVRLER